MTNLTKIEKLEELIKDSIDGELVEQTVTSLLPPGENYGSVIYKVDFKVRNKGTKEEYHAVAKCTPPHPVTQRMFNTQVTFKSEIAWYTKVIPIFKEFQRENGVEQVADFFQTFYGARISLDPKSEVVDAHGVILTENLKYLGYDNVDRHVGFDLKTTKSILRDLASFHAIPLAIKINKKEIFDANIRPFLPNVIMEDHPYDNIEQFDNMINAIGEIPEIVQYKDRVAYNIRNFKPFPSDSTTNEPWGSVSHNDLWSNNIMVKHEDNPKVMILDLQCPFYGSIAIDVIFFLTTSVILDVIQDNLDNLIEFYWDNFINNLKQLNVDTSLFPYEGFLEELSEVSFRGQFPHIVFHIFMILLDKGDKDLENNYKKKDLLNYRHVEKFTWLVSEFAKRKWI